MKNLEWLPISREDNAWHYDEHPDYWQWLYFDFIFTNGYTAAAVILPRSIGSIPGVSFPELSPEIWLTVLTPSAKRYDVKKAYPHSECRGERKGLNVQVGKNLLHFKSNRYHLDFHEGELGMELVINPVLPPWTPLDEKGFAPSEVMQTLKTDPPAYFNYIEFVPRGEVEGILTVAGDKIPVRGLGYHEQGRGNFPLCRLFQRWFWLKFWLDEFTFIMPGGSFVPEFFNTSLTFALLARKEKKILELTEFGQEIVKESNPQVEPTTKATYPGRMEFQLSQKEISLTGILESGPPVEAFIYNYPNQKPKIQPAYLRFLARLKLHLEIGSEKIDKIGFGMQEIMIAGG